MSAGICPLNIHQPFCLRNDNIINAQTARQHNDRKYDKPADNS